MLSSAREPAKLCGEKTNADAYNTRCHKAEVSVGKTKVKFFHNCAYNLDGT